MSAPQGDGNGNGDNLDDVRHRLALAQAARANATREEIEARGIRPDVQQILHHMNNRTPSHTFKRARLNDSMAHRIYEDKDEDEDAEEEHRGKNTDDEEKEFELQWQAMLAAEGLLNANMFVLAEFRQIACQRIHKIKQATAQWRSACRPPKKDRFDLLASLCTCPDLIVGVCKHMRPLDIVHIYSISRDFHAVIDSNMRTSIFAWASHMAPTAARIYSSPVYHRWFIPDPDHRRVTAVDKEMSKTQPGQAKIDDIERLNTVEGEIRMVPGLLWLQMVVHREIRVRDIIACLARRGHRLPKGTHVVLKKLWLVMDAATSQARVILLRNADFFSDEELYIAQLFMIKLILCFNDPIFGPQSSMLMRLMLGQQSLSPLWALLRGKQYRTKAEIRQLKLRYDVGANVALSMNLRELEGVPVEQLGIMHFEGWGTGPDHLMRPDELIPREAVRRQLDLDNCIEEMMIYGHVDFRTGNSLVPSLDKMYMSDDELAPAHRDWRPMKHELINSGCGNVPFDSGTWLPKHARKARWKTLTDKEKAMILKSDQEEMDEVRELDRAQWNFSLGWARFAHMISVVKSTKSLQEEFKLFDPSEANMKDQLDQFAQPRRLKLASNYNDPDSDEDVDADAMDIDDNPSPSNHTATLAFRPAQHHQPIPNPDDLSTIPDEDLALDPISASEVNRIINSFRRFHRPQSETDTEGDENYEGEDEDDEDYHPQVHVQPQIQTDDRVQQQDEQKTDSEYFSEEDDEFEDDHPLPAPPIYNVDPTLVLNTPITALSENTDEMLLAQADLEYSDGDNDEGDQANNNNRSSPKGNGSGRISDNDGDALMMLMGEDSDSGSDEVDVNHPSSSNHNHNPGQQQNANTQAQDAAVVGMGGVFGVDWDHFLRNPQAYEVEGEGGVEVPVPVVPVHLPAVDDDETEEEEEEGDGKEDGEDEDGDVQIGEEDGGQGDGGEDDEEGDEEDDDGLAAEINLLPGGLQVDSGGGGGDGQDAFQQVAQQMAGPGGAAGEGDDEINLEMYVADEDLDEDLGEDDRTRKLRDWYRPW